MMDEEEEEREGHGKYGTEKHRELIKEAMHFITDRYFNRYGPFKLEVENNTISASASMSGHRYGYSRDTDYELNPDILCQILEAEGGDIKKELVVECETSKYNMLSNEMRMTAYKLLRLKHSDKSKFMMYIVFPEELKGKVEKPECFNDLWFFDVSDASEEEI